LKLKLIKSLERNDDFFYRQIKSRIKIV